WLCLCIFRCFFFQAEDGIRDRNVTGVQTCALPIYHFICSTWRKFNTGGFLALTRGDKPKLLAYLSICSPGCSRPGGTIWGKMQHKINGHPGDTVIAGELPKRISPHDPALGFRPAYPPLLPRA